MRKIAKRVLRDERNQPVAVQIDYSDWLEIERALEDEPAPAGKVANLAHWRGVIQLAENPVEWQRRIRDEWP